MKNLFDIHCHILPEVDDGAKTMDMALKMLQMEYKDGVRSIILTPHFRREMFETSQEKIEQQFKILKAKTEEKKKPDNTSDRTENKSEEEQISLVDVGMTG